MLSTIIRVKVSLTSASRCSSVTPWLFQSDGISFNNCAALSRFGRLYVWGAGFNSFNCFSSSTRSLRYSSSVRSPHLYNCLVRSSAYVTRFIWISSTAFTSSSLVDPIIISFQSSGRCRWVSTRSLNCWLKGSIEYDLGEASQLCPPS